MDTQVCEVRSQRGEKMVTVQLAFLLTLKSTAREGHWAPASRSATSVSPTSWAATASVRFQEPQTADRNIRK